LTIGDAGNDKMASHAADERKMAVTTAAAAGCCCGHPTRNYGTSVTSTGGGTLVFRGSTEPVKFRAGVFGTP